MISKKLLSPFRIKTVQTESSTEDTPLNDSYTESFYSDLDYASSSLNRDFPVPEYNEYVLGPTDYVKNLTKNPVKKSVFYVKSLFPVIKWIHHYPFNANWMINDLITGVTVAIVLVPQAMSYAKIATLSPEYGLYSSFMGLMIYAFFATSKDVSIGPVAVMSLEVSKVIARVQAKHGDAYTGPQIATTVSLLCGAICLGCGLLRLGFLVELIPLPAVMAFTTGSAFNILVGQLPGLFGYSSKVNTRSNTYKVVINFLKFLPDTKVDVAFGLVGLFILFVWKYTCDYLMKRNPSKKRIYLFIQNMRSAFVIIISTVISWAIMRHRKNGKQPYKLTGVIKSGLDNVGLFTPPPGIAKAVSPELPVSVIVLVLEHISIAKSFGRINGYKIDPNQEVLAIGVANMLGTFFNAYPVTGSFSRTALSAKCGVKTPFAKVIAGSCVILAIYCFTDAFYWIPAATLSAIIIHAVSDLPASWRATYGLYLTQPIDFIIFIAGVLITVFATIEDGIYFAMCASAALIFWRLCITNGTFLGKIKYAEIINPQLQPNLDENDAIATNSANNSLISTKNNPTGEATGLIEKNNIVYQYKWVPMPTNSLNSSSIHTRYVNKNIQILPPPPGVIIYRLSESFVYPNSSHQADMIIDEVKRKVRPLNLNMERMWNNPGKLDVKASLRKFAHVVKTRDFSQFGKDDQQDDETAHLPSLRVIHLDFSQVVGTDATSIQALIDMRTAIQLHSGDNFEIHFSGIINPWTIRGLVNAGFAGATKGNKKEEVELNVDIEEEKFREEEGREFQESIKDHKFDDVETGPELPHYVSVGFGSGGIYPLSGTNFPNFFFEIPSYEKYDS